MEQLASDRDSVLHACAAQDPKLLPKYDRQKNSNTGVAQMQAVVSRLAAKGDY